MSRSSTFLKIALAASVPIVAMGVTVRRDIDARWHRMALEIDQMAAERRARDTTREAPLGGTTEGPAWPHYEVALAEMDRVWEALPIRNFDAVEAGTADQRAERDALLLELAPAFEALHRGAHARDARTGMDLADGGLDGVRLMTRAHYLCTFAVARAKAQFERGEDQAGVATLLDAQQLGRDLAVAPYLIEEMMGLAILVDQGLLVWLAAGGAGEMSVQAKERWLDGMDRFRATIPAQSPAWAGELERLGRDLQRTVKPAAPEAPGVSLAGWRGPSSGPGLVHRFSWRAAGADFVSRGPEFLRRAEVAYGLPPVAMIEALEDLQREMKADDNPLVDSFGRSLVTVGMSRTYCLARLDFLRHALAVHLGRDAELPADPWGHGVRVEIDGDHVRVWTPNGEGTGPLDVTVCSHPR